MLYNPSESFLLEAEDLLAQVEESALSLRKGGQTEETVNTLFRAFHTIKGSGAMCGFDAVADFTHHVESLLDQVREGAMPESPKLVELVLKAKDQIKTLLGEERSSASAASDSSKTLIAAVEALANTGESVSRRESIELAPQFEQQAGLEQTWSIRFRPSPDLLTSGGSPIALLKELRQVGSCQITATTEDVPTRDRLLPDLCYLGWTIILRTAAGENAIRDVFLFVEDGTKLEIERIDGAPQDRLSRG